MVCIRKARYSDLQNIVEIDAELVGDGSYPHYSVRQYFDLFKDSFHVAEVDKKLVAYSLLGVAAFSRRAWLLAIGVVVGHRGRGIGTLLLEQGINYCNENAIRICRLTVEPANDAAISFYERFGFTKIAAEKNYYRVGDSKIIMAKQF